MINQLDLGRALGQGVVVGNAMQRADQERQLQNVFAQHGQGLMNGDPTALNALAAIDGPMALQMRQQIDAGNRAKAAETRAIAAAGRDERLFDAQMQKYDREAAEYVRAQGAEKALAETEATRRAIAGASAFVQRGDEAGYNAYLQQNGFDPAEYPMGQFDAIARSLMGFSDAIESYAKGMEPAGPQSSIGKIQADIDAGLLPPNTPLRTPSTQIYTGDQFDPRPIVDKPEKGYQRRWDEEAGKWVDEPIAGSSVAVDAADTAAKSGEKTRQQRLKLGTTLTNIGMNIEEISNGGAPVTGVWGAARRTWAGRALTGEGSVDFQTRTNQINNDAAFAEIQRMRDNSPTGGAVGQLTDKEREAIGQAITTLNEAGSEEEYLRAARAYRKLALDMAYGEGQWSLSGDEVVVSGSDAPQGAQATVIDGYTIRAK